MKNPPWTSRRRRASRAPRGVEVLLIRLASWLGVRAAHPENVMAPLALGQAWALLQAAGIEADLIDTELGGWDRARLVEALSARSPRLVVLAGISPSVPLMVELAGALRARLPRAFLLAVGQHATAEPADLLGPGGFDACATGEAEETILDLARAQADGELAAIPGLVLAAHHGATPIRGQERPLRSDLDALPWSWHPSFLDRRYRVYFPVDVPGRLRWGFVLASRGCPHGCIYCSGTLRNSYGRAYRHRSPESVTAVVGALAARGVTVLHFQDDVFSEDRAHTLALVRPSPAANARCPSPSRPAWIAWTRSCSGPSGEPAASRSDSGSRPAPRPSRTACARAAPSRRPGTPSAMLARPGCAGSASSCSAARARPLRRWSRPWRSRASWTRISCRWPFSRPIRAPGSGTTSPPRSARPSPS
ncbi:MAG: cobalamin-dependent protein [Pseudomonadota bacterium]